MIPEEEIEQAVEWLRANARKAAQARAERIYVEQYRKTVKAQLMSEKLSDPIGAQERYAYAHASYIAHLAGLKEAIQRDEEMQWLRAAAEAKIEAWRTQNANARAEGRATA